MRRFAHLLAVASLLAGCSSASSPSSDGKGPESDPPIDGKADNVNGIVEHSSPIQEIHEIGVTFTPEMRGHAFRFTLGMNEHVSIYTALFSGDSGPEVDTVLYLFKKGDNGWGHYIRRNDDDSTRDGTSWSRIEADLEPGEYRILAKAYDDSVMGALAVNMGCADGRCDYYDPSSIVPEPDLGVGDPDPVGTDPATLVVPILDENDEKPLSRFNAQLAAAGLPQFPDTLVIESGSSAWSEKLDALATQAARDDVLAVTGAELLMYTDLETAVSGGLCYQGNASTVPDVLAGLSDAVLSDQFSVWGWRAGDLSAYDDWHEPTSASSIYEEWKSYDPQSKDVFMVWSVDDDGNELTSSVPPCK